jgi:V8-like Glu-specific endopeptidase
VFFTEPGVGNFVCSASVIQRRFVLTAGHCVHQGSGGASGFFTNFLFVPAYRDGVAPFKAWQPVYVITTSAWATGSGVVPNAADYAMFEMQDEDFDTVTYRIGEVTGWLGWQTQSLIPNHAHLLGYPASFDSGAKMHQVTAGSFRSVAPLNVEYGSDMTGGSSGGPWVQNFGAKAVGQLGGLNPGRNRVVGVTSYGYISSDPKIQGSSIPDDRFVTLFNTTCAYRVGNCEP